MDNSQIYQEKLIFMSKNSLKWSLLLHVKVKRKSFKITKISKETTLLIHRSVLLNQEWNLESFKRPPLDRIDIEVEVLIEYFVQVIHLKSVRQENSMLPKAKINYLWNKEAKVLVK